jgi:tetratricopeptide (TPR) repeat protein
LLREGIAAARAGQKDRARELLLQVIALDEELEAAWLWLSGVVDDPEERQICLENVLTLNPDHVAAQRGLRWLREQGLGPVPEQASVPPPGQTQPPLQEAQESPRLVLGPPPPETLPTEPVLSAESSLLPDTPPSPKPPPVNVVIEPFGCPYCGGSVSGGGPRCDHCRRLVEVRYRKRTTGVGLGWLVLFFVLQGATAWLEGFLLRQLVEIGHLPEWLTESAVRFLIGGALFSPGGIPGDLAALADTVILINLVVGGLCVVTAVGLALHSRAVYFGSCLLAGLLVVATGVGLLTQLTGWLPAFFRLGLVAVSIKWLIDSAPAFEWETRRYDADVDQELKKDLDYYNRGQRYREMGMWAKAAAHWKVAVQLAPSQVKYRAALAGAYARMGYPAAALAEADKALARAPDDNELLAFRNSLAELEGSQ